MNWKRIFENLVSLFIYGIVMSIILTIIFSLLISEAQAAPFVTPNMIKRNGLTDYQYERLWSQGKHPQIDIGAARDWIFRASRYQNVTNWLDICGKSNDFARLSYVLQDKNFNLSATNLMLVATNRQLSATCERLAVEVYEQWSNYTNQLVETETFSNKYVIASAMAESANAKIQDEISDLEAKIEKYKEYQTKYPLLKSVFAAMITDAENRIKVLQTLTGGVS